MKGLPCIALAVVLAAVAGVSGYMLRGDSIASLHFQRIEMAQASVFRAHRIAAMIDIAALEALASGHAQTAVEYLNGQLDFEILGLSSKYKSPTAGRWLEQCQLKRIHQYRLDHPKNPSGDALYLLERDILASMPTPNGVEKEDTCLHEMIDVTL